MKSRDLGFAIFAALSLQFARAVRQTQQPRPATTADINTPTTDNATNTTADASNFVDGYGDSPIRVGSREIDFGSLDSPMEESAAGLSEERGKKKKTKNPSMNMMVGGSMMAAFAVIVTFLSMITVTLGKALFFTFIAKFLISVNWKSSESSSKKKPSRNDMTLIMT